MQYSSKEQIHQCVPAESKLPIEAKEQKLRSERGSSKADLWRDKRMPASPAALRKAVQQWYFSPVGNL